MHGEADIYDQIVADRQHAAPFFEELVCMGRKPEEILRGIEAAESRLQEATATPFHADNSSTGLSQ